MFDVTVFGSGSSGNCIYVDTGDCKFLLDAGLSFKDTKVGLKKVGVRLSDIDFICISHTHSDHIMGLKNIVDKYDTPIITSWGESLSWDISPANINVISNRKTINICNTNVTAYDCIHDTMEPLYFSIENSIGEKLLYLTDCGDSSGISVDDHDIFIIEANYYLEGILSSVQSGKIHIVQYNRTTSGTGHLELNQTIEILKDSVGKKTKHIILSHLSSANGNKALFEDKVKNALSFDNVDVAEKGLHVVIGENPNIF